MKKSIITLLLLIIIPFIASAADPTPKFKRLNNFGNSTTIVLSYPETVKSISKAVFTNDGKNYEAKSVKSKGEKDGTSKITLKFKRLTYFNSCYVKIAINGKEYMIPTGSAGIKIDQSSTSRNNNGKTE